MVSDAGCERTHKEKKVQKVKFLFTLQERRRAWCGEIRQHGGVGALSSYWIITGLKRGWGGCYFKAPGLLGTIATQQVWGGFAQAAVCSNVIFCLWQGGS